MSKIGSTSTATPAAEQTETAIVWDPLVRIFHWSLATAFVIAYLTEDEFMALHVWAGYSVGGLIIFRILWGLVGTKHARFTDFLFGPFTTLGYMSDLIRFRSKRYLGHNPAAAVMILALLITLSATVWSGLELYAVEENKGPLAATAVTTAVEADTGVPTLILVDDRENGNDNRGKFWEDIHEALANFTLVLVFLHIGGVLWSSFAHRENLVWSMITGRKRRD